MSQSYSALEDPALSNPNHPFYWPDVAIPQVSPSHSPPDLPDSSTSNAEFDDLFDASLFSDDSPNDLFANDLFTNEHLQASSTASYDSSMLAPALGPDWGDAMATEEDANSRDLSGNITGKEIAIIQAGGAKAAPAPTLPLGVPLPVYATSSTTHSSSLSLPLPRSFPDPLAENITDSHQFLPNTSVPSAGLAHNPSPLATVQLSSSAAGVTATATGEQPSISAVALGKRKAREDVEAGDQEANELGLTDQGTEPVVSKKQKRQVKPRPDVMREYCLYCAKLCTNLEKHQSSVTCEKKKQRWLNRYEFPNSAEPFLLTWVSASMPIIRTGLAPRKLPNSDESSGESAGVMPPSITPPPITPPSITPPPIAPSPSITPPSITPPPIAPPSQSEANPPPQADRGSITKYICVPDPKLFPPNFPLTCVYSESYLITPKPSSAAAERGSYSVHVFKDTLTKLIFTIPPIRSPPRMPTPLPMPAAPIPAAPTPVSFMPTTSMPVSSMPVAPMPTAPMPVSSMPVAPMPAVPMPAAPIPAALVPNYVAGTHTMPSYENSYQIPNLIPQQQPQQLSYSTPGSGYSQHIDTSSSAYDMIAVATAPMMGWIPDPSQLHYTDVPYPNISHTQFTTFA